MSVKKPSTTEEYQQRMKELREEASLEKEQESFALQQAELDAAYVPREDDEKDPRNKDVSSEWEELISLAKVYFPEGKDHFTLTAKNRLVAIASALGWSERKISEHGGISRSTVSKWLKRSDVKVFIEEFQFKKGDKDVMEKFGELESKGVRFVNSLLESRDDSEGIKRLKLDATKWVFERSRGKPNQPVEHKGESLGQVMLKLGEIGKSIENVTEEDEKDAFTIN